jgi:YidC/Oxa1 family membrane protein insertase
MIWDNFLKRLETDIEYNRRYTTINYWTTSGSHEDLSASSSDKVEETFSESVNWFAFKQRFFTNGYVFNKPVNTGYISSEFIEKDTLVSKYCRAMIDLPLSNFAQDAGANTYYYGPNRIKDLKTVAPGFKENLEVGWPVVKWINQYAIIPIFQFLEKYIGSYGIIIIILVFILKIVLSPLTYKSHISMAKTKALKPELDELKEKYGDDMQKMQAEQMKLYQQVGVNPLSGCIPMLLQMPILFAMFQFIPHAIELRHESFLWAPDLSTYDAIIRFGFEIPFYGSHVSLFTILMTVSTILYTWINSQATAQMQGPMKSMQYFMPVIFMFVLNNFPAGLTFYYFVSNLVSFGQIAIIRKFVDDDKIRAILEENKLKNKDKKKSKFQSRLENAMKATEAAKKNKGKK